MSQAQLCCNDTALLWWVYHQLHVSMYILLSIMSTMRPVQLTLRFGRYILQLLLTTGLACDVV